MYDPELYRSKEEVEAWKARDPIPALEARLRADGSIDEEGLARTEEMVASEIDDAVAFAEAGTDEPADQLTRFVHSEPVP
jgi:TPP-dependent pyruvate/acetoin dehydrogenase alpha subunit